MTGRSPTADHPPLSSSARNRLVGDAVTANLVTQLGARLAMVDVVELAARLFGGARG